MLFGDQDHAETSCAWTPSVKALNRAGARAGTGMNASRDSFLPRSTFDAVKNRFLHNERDAGMANFQKHGRNVHGQVLKAPGAKYFRNWPVGACRHAQRHRTDRLDFVAKSRSGRKVRENAPRAVRPHLDSFGPPGRSDSSRCKGYWRRRLDTGDNRYALGRRQFPLAPGEKLLSLNILFRPKVTAVLEQLKQAGFRPKIFFGWRSVAKQEELFKQGKTKVHFSFHNAQFPDGTPNSYAVDIIDERWGWGKPAEANGFWAALGAAAKAQGLVWGGDWATFPDLAHIQSRQNSALAAVKKESGL